MNKKDLTEAIQDGILKGFWKPILGIIIGVFIAEIIIIGIIVYGSYLNNLAIEDGTNQPIATQSIQSCFPLDKIKCTTHLIVNNTIAREYLKMQKLCGWEEVNEWFKYEGEFGTYKRETIWLDCVVIS